MDSESPIPPNSVDSTFELGIVLGHRRTLSALNGRCSAGHAAALREIRDRRLYLPRARSWEEFCGQAISITKRHADRLIALFNEFGAAYFELAELAGITPDQYRRIQPLIQEHGIVLNGDPILVIPDNARQLHRAVRELILQAESEIAPNRPRARATPANLAVLTRRADKLVSAFRRLYKRAQLPADRALILDAIRHLNHALSQIH